MVRKFENYVFRQRRHLPDPTVAMNHSSDPINTNINIGLAIYEKEQLRTDAHLELKILRGAGRLKISDHMFFMLEI